MMNMINTHTTKHKAQSTKHKAQYNYALNLSSKSNPNKTKKIYKKHFVVIDVLKSVLSDLEILFTNLSSSNKNNFTHEEILTSSHTNYPAISVVDFSNRINSVYNKNLFKGEFNMNNKKLFKGALVLFASILMAVSCSKNEEGGSNTPTTPETPQVDKEIKVSVVAGDNNANSSKNTTLSVQEEASSGDKMDPSHKKLTITLDGTDIAKLTTGEEKEKIKVSVKAFNGLKETSNSAATGEQDMTSKQFKPVADMFETLAVSTDDKQITLDLKDAFAVKAGLNNSQSGVIEIIFELTDNANVKTSKEIKAYFVYLGKNG